MRTAAILTASTLLAGTIVVLPVVSVGAAPHAVAPTVKRVGMPAGRVLADPSTVQRPAASARRAVVTESVLTRETDGADVVGVGFPDREAAQGVSVEVRSRTGGTWGSWTPVGLSDAAPDSDSAEGERAKLATEPVGIIGSDQVQVRVRTAKASPHLDALSATFVNGGSSAADGSVGVTPPAAARAAATQPTIISRAAWGADESMRTCAPEYLSRIKGAVVHHTVNANTYTADQVPGLLRGIYAYHVNGNGWCDIGYQFLADRFGRLFEGRYGGIYKNIMGAQSGGFNSQTFGVASLGNHDPNTPGAVAPTSGELSAISKLIGWKSWLNGWDPTTSVTFTAGTGSNRWPAGSVITRPRVVGHRDFSFTECPGDLMYSKLSTIRSGAATVYRAGVASATAEVTSSSVVETYTRPSGTSISLSGHGYGHGRGMSQYGAYGAALKGLTRDGILKFYYPGTTLSTTLGNPTVRVWIAAAGAKGTEVRYQDGLSVTDGSRTLSLYSKNADGTVRTKWRIYPEGTGLSLQWFEGSWRSRTGWSGLSTPLTFLNPKAGSVRVALPDGTQRDYRRSIRTVRSGTSTLAVNLLPMDEYLRGVVPPEMPPSWPAASLQAQAVAARTFAAYQKKHQPAGSAYDTCDSTACQVYRGMAGYSSSGTRTSFEYPSTTAAVTATTTLGVLYAGVPALTQFSSSNGGQTVASSLAYQISKVDPYDPVPAGSPSSWSTTLAVSKVESAFPATGTLHAIRLDKRDGIGAWGGRVSSVTVIGSKGSATISGDTFRSALGLRSTWWTITSAPAVSAASLAKDLAGNRRGDLLATDPSGRLRLLSGNGKQAFTSTLLSTGWGSYGLVANVGAWNGDNRQDVVERDAGSLYYHPGNGRGGFFPRVRISTGWDSVNLVTGAGDMDGDRHADLVTRTTTGELKIQRGNGKGGILGAISLGTGWGGYRLVLSPGDLTGDDKPDILAVRASDNVMRLFPGTGKGTLTTPVTVSGSWSGYSALTAAGDVTGDGRDDVVARRRSDGALVVFAGNDMGALSLGSVVPGTSTWATWTRWAP